MNLDGDQGQEEALANILMAVCLILMHKSRPYSYSRLFRLFFKDYKPLYHPSSRLKKNIQKIIRDLDRLDCFEKFNGILTERSKIETKENTINQEEFIHLIDCHCPRTLFRPREEYELLQILIKLTENILMAIDRIHENMEEKYSLLVKMELRSRQRKTLQRALKILPELKLMFSQLCCNIFLILENVINLSSSRNDLKSLTGVLKKILKSCENIVSSVSLQKNRWEESGQIVIDVNEMFPILENIVCKAKS